MAKKKSKTEQLSFFTDTIPENIETKKCNKCEKDLPLSCFSPSGGGTYLRPECKECNYKLSQIRKKLYKETEYPDKNYICPICLRPLEEIKNMGGNAGPWVLDHNHDTEEFRGFLCHACNRALGNFNDNIERMKRAIEYLKENS